MSTHLTLPPHPARRTETLPCEHCQLPTECSHDAVRVVCGECTQQTLRTPGPIFTVRPQARQLELAEVQS